jgi:hypothetical protein
MILVVSVLTIMTMALSPALAHDWDGDGWDEEFGLWVLVPVFVDFEVDCDWDDCDWDDYDWDDGDHNDWAHRDWNDCDGPVCLID